jgi:hypothetical protein
MDRSGLHHMRNPDCRDSRQNYDYSFIWRDHPVWAKFENLTGKCAFEAGAEFAACY